MNRTKSVLKWLGNKLVAFFSAWGDSIVDSRRRQVEAYLSKSTSREDLNHRMTQVYGRGI